MRLLAVGGRLYDDKMDEYMRLAKLLYKHLVVVQRHFSGTLFVRSVAMQNEYVVSSGSLLSLVTPHSFCHATMDSVARSVAV